MCIIGPVVVFNADEPKSNVILSLKQLPSRHLPGGFAIFIYTSLAHYHHAISSQSQVIGSSHHTLIINNSIGIDPYTWWMEAIPISGITAETVANAFYGFLLWITLQTDYKLWCAVQIRTMT